MNVVFRGWWFAGSARARLTYRTAHGAMVVHLREMMSLDKSIFIQASTRSVHVTLTVLFFLQQLRISY
jgi:hypothetical protein